MTSVLVTDSANSARTSLSPAFAQALKDAVGPDAYLDDDTDIAPYLDEQRDLLHGHVDLVLFPRSTDAVAAIVKLCAREQVAVFPMGGNTNLVGSAVPISQGPAVILNLKRMNRVRAVDATGFTISVDAGCILKDVQDVAAEAGCLFPLSLGAEGSCQIGGNLSTNAGGIQVLRYGTTRDLTLGLEVVLPDGRVWSRMRPLRKDNTGYDLKHLFIGAEGTLGIITGATLRLFPQPRDVVTAFVGLSSPASVIELLGRMRREASDVVSAFEGISRFGVDLATQHIDGVRDPLSDVYPWYALIEMSGTSADGELAHVMESVLGRAMEDELVLDAVVSASGAQSQALWELREGIVEAQKFEGQSLKHDVSVPVADIPAFLEESIATLQEAFPSYRLLPFGHFGDGNVHYNVCPPAGMTDEDFLASSHDVARIVYDMVERYKGSISAEHGIGRLKRDELSHYRPDIDLDLMRRVKSAFDPLGIMNPGSMFDMSARSGEGVV